MLTRVLSRGLFFRRGSQVDFTGRPLGDRKINVEDIKVVHSHPNDVVGAMSSDGGSQNEPETSPQKPDEVIHSEGHDVENHPVIPGAVPSGLGGTHQALEYPSDAHKPSHASSESGDAYVFGDTTGVTVGAEDETEEADEIFQTPLHQTPYLVQPEDETSTKQRFIEHFEDTGCPSKTPSIDGPPDMPIMESRATQGMLSDITEADESGPQELSTEESKHSLNLLRVRTLSFSSFGSSYPSSCFGSPSPDNHPSNGITTTCSITLSSPDDDGLTQSIAQPVSHEVADLGQRLSTSASSTSDFVPFIVEPLLSSNSVDQLGEEGLDNEHKDEHQAQPEPMPAALTNVVPSVSTYADATNLALQHPEMASDILRRPLSSTSTSACPSKFPTPAVSSSVSLQVVPPASASCTPLRAGTPHTAERPNWALAPDVSARGRSGSTATPKEHTAEHPNWALAKNEPKSPPNRRSRSRSRARGRGGTRPPSITRGTEQWTRRGTLIPDIDQVEIATVHTSPVVSPKQKLECDNALPVGPSQAANLEDGPQQWLNRVNTWVEQTSRGPKTCPSTPDPDANVQCASTSPPYPKEQPNQLRRHSRTTSGLNPHAPVWTPAPRARCQTPSDSDSAPPPTQSQSSPSTSSARGPFTYGVDADIDRLRDMLRNCGIQDKDTTVASFSSGDTTTSGSSGSTPSGPEETECVPSSDEDSQTTTGAYGQAREVDKTPERVDPRGTARPDPQVVLPRQAFEFTAPTRLGPPFALNGPIFVRTTKSPQNLFVLPPRFASLRANAQPFRKEPGGSRINGRFDPGPSVSSSGLSGLPQPTGSGPSSFSFSSSAPGPAPLSFSQANHPFSSTCQPDPGSSDAQGVPAPFLPLPGGSYKVRVNCTEQGEEIPIPIPPPIPVLNGPVSPLAAGVKRPRQPTVGPSTFKSQRFA